MKKIIFLRAGIVFVILLVSVMLNEIGHFIAAFFYGLGPRFILTKYYVGIEAISGTALQNQMILNSGVIANLLVVLFLFFYIIFRSESYFLFQDNVSFYVIMAVIINLSLAHADLIQPFLYHHIPLSIFPGY